MLMSNRGKTAILVVLIIIALGLAGGVFYLFQEEQKKTATLQTELEETQARLSVTESKLKESENSIKQLETQLQETKSQINILSADLKKEQEEKIEALSKLEQLKIDLEEQKKLRTEFEGRLNLAQDSVKKAQNQFKDLEIKKALLESKIAALETQAQNQEQDVELGKIVVAPPEGSKSTTSAVGKTAEKKLLEGKVLVVNKEFNFAVINLGNKDGVKIGDTFLVYHSNNYIGDIELEKIHDSMAAAGFITGNVRGRISEGDRVVKK